MVHFQCWLVHVGPADNFRWNTGDRAVGRHVFQHDAAGADLGAAAHFHIAEDLRAGADEHAMANLGMAVAFGFTGAAGSDALDTTISRFQLSLIRPGDSVITNDPDWTPP